MKATKLDGGFFCAPHASKHRTEDLATHGLKRGDLGTVVEVYSPAAIEVEFVSASGRTQGLVTLPVSAVRKAADDDLVAVRPATRRDAS
jgi:hypothetical protein